MANGAAPSPSVPPGSGSNEPLELVGRVTRPGSFRKSTSLWWTVPPGIAWLCIAAGAAITRTLTDRSSAGLGIEWVILVDLSATSAWVVLVVFTQNEKDTSTAEGLIDPVGRHEFWRARTVAWDLLSVSLVGALLVAFLIVGPSTVLPSADVPLVELAVLIVTILLLATFSRYAAMAFNTDAARMVQTLEQLSEDESEARTKDTDRVTKLFTEQTDRIVAKADAQIAATSTGLSAAVAQLDRVARAVEDLTKIERETQSATQVIAETQRLAAEEQRRLVAERRAEETRLARARADEVRPALSVQLRWHGLVVGDLTLDVYNDGPDGTGLEVGVYVAGLAFSRSSGRLGAKLSQAFQIVDVRQIPLAAQITVAAAIRDMDGHLNRYQAGPFAYVRVTGVLGRTKGVTITPTGWVRATPLPT